jgi:putative DNA primase/helicase
MGSFEAWSGWVRDALLWLGKADPVDTMDAAREADPRRTAIVAVFSQWHTVIGTDKVSVTVRPS